jgi:uncharacterized protein YkwD
MAPLGTREDKPWPHGGQDDCTTPARILFMRCPVAVIPLILLALAPLSCASPDSTTYTSAPSPAASASSAPSATVSDLTNAERSRAGLASLTVDVQLNTAAQLQAAQLAALGVLQHDIPNGTYPTPTDRLAAAGYTWQAYGENIASGYPSPGETVAAWMNSPGHRGNILNPSFTELGTASAIDATGRKYWVQVFGKPG